MKELEKVFRALGNRRRLQMVQLLSQKGEMPVVDISRTLRFSYRATSKHVNLLAATAILDKEQRGGCVYYRIADDLSKLAKSVLPHIR